MNQPIDLKTSILAVRNSISHAITGCGSLFVSLALTWFALSPTAQGISPAPDGAYPGSNTAEGTNALFSLTTGLYNTANGFNALFSDTTGGYNTANGVNALYSNTGGFYNTASGLNSLYSNTTGNYNTATGEDALFSNTTGSYNTANGDYALFANTTGNYQTATGLGALFSNTTGSYNTANGDYALYSNITGGFNAANGDYALYSNTTGSLNTANGYQALFSNTTGTQNTATGYAALNRNTANANTAYGYTALAFNTSGFNNTAIGAQALNSCTIGTFNTAIGEEALKNITTGLNNIALGESAGLNHTADDGQNIDIGNTGVAGDNRTTRIGSSTLRAFIAGIYGVNEGGTISAVYINSNGQLGTQAPPSSRRFKKEIKPMDRTSEALLALKPVTFQYKSDTKGIPQFGLIAEEVAEVNPDLVVRDADGGIYTVRYDAVNAMLLNEFLKEHRKVEEQDAAITQLKSTVAKQEATIGQQQKGMELLAANLKEQASQIQKVSDRVEMGKSTPQLVDNNQ